MSLNEIVEQLQREAALSGSHYDIGGTPEGYDADAYSDDGDHFARGLPVRRMTIQRAPGARQVTAATVGGGGGAASTIGDGVHGIVGPVTTSAGPAPGASPLVAQVTITATRRSSNIAASLPYVLFGGVLLRSGYRRFLQGLIPTGVTLQAVLSGEPASLPEVTRFIYDDGASQDAIDITCSAAPYPDLVEATLIDSFRASSLRVQATDAVADRVFANDIVLVSRTTFGRSQQNPLSPASNRSPRDYQVGVVDIPVPLQVDKETAIIHALPEHNSAVSASFIFNISSYSARRGL